MTQEEIAARREQARQRHAEMLANNPAFENGTPLIVESTCEERKEDESNDVPAKQKANKQVPKSHMLAFARVYSGTIKKGQQLYVLGPKHDPRETSGVELGCLKGQEQR